MINNVNGYDVRCGGDVNDVSEVQRKDALFPTFWGPPKVISHTNMKNIATCAKRKMQISMFMKSYLALL